VDTGFRKRSCVKKKRDPEKWMPVFGIMRQEKTRSRKVDAGFRKRLRVKNNRSKYSSLIPAKAGIQAFPKAVSGLPLAREWAKLKLA
jgi:hypothetical protein